jgi:sarcosine dehydrogenase
MGELGWELHTPVESAHIVYDTLHNTAATALTVPLIDGGYYAIESLRLEKAYRAWGHEISPDDSPILSGLTFAVDFSKQFIGREALLRQKNSALPITRRLISLKLADNQVMAWGGEPVLFNGKVVGRMTSAAFGHRVGASVGMAYITHEGVGTKGFFDNANDFQVDVSGQRCRVASISLRALYDPKGERVHS